MPKAEVDRRQRNAHPLLEAFVSAGISDMRIARHYGVTDRTVLRWRKQDNLESKWVPAKTASHGSMSVYRRGCRCHECKAANTEYHGARRASEVMPASAKHGTYSVALNYRCKCGPCRKSVADYNRAHRNYLAHRKYFAKLYRKTLDEAHRHRFVWTSAELELANRRDLSATEVAKIIGRTVHAVSSKRHRLAKNDPITRILIGDRSF